MLERAQLQIQFENETGEMLAQAGYLEDTEDDYYAETSGLIEANMFPDPKDQ